MNINSIRARLNILRVYLADDPSYHFFGIAESWLGPVVDDSVIQIDGYSVYRQDRNISGGGVALYARADYNIKILASSNTQVLGKPSTPEYLFCQAQRGDSTPILIGVIYRPPHIAMQKDTDFFDVLRDLACEYSHKFIMGDLNADLSSTADADANTVRNLAKESALQIIQHGPTHHKTPTSHTWIDLILTDENDEVLAYENKCLPSFGKHAIIDVTINHFVPAPVRESFSCRNFKNISTDTLNELLATCDWASMDSIESDLEGALENLNTNLNQVIDKLAPLKDVHPKKKYAPFMTIGRQARRNSSTV